jgi:hypothetical protein
MRTPRTSSATFAGFVIAALVTVRAGIGHAATPASGQLAPGGAALSWSGFDGPAAAPQSTATTDTLCQDGVNCDVFTLTLAPGDYSGKRVRVALGWTSALNDYDLYVHRDALTGTVVADSSDPAPDSIEQDTFDVNAVLATARTYYVHVVYYAVGAGDPYRGSASVETMPAGARVATFVKGEESGIKFSKSRTVYATGATKNVEPSTRVDYLGNAYVGGIRGLTGGNDLWRFDLDPKSPTFDPLLTKATAAFDANGNVSNPAYLGQPDSILPEGEGELGGDGGGDLDLAVGFKPSITGLFGDRPTLAASSLVAANVSTQRSTDMGDSFLMNPVGNTTVQVDDRQWNEFLGGDTVYLAYRQFTGVTTAIEYYVNRSDDGGFTYGPAVVAAIGGNTTGNIDVDQRDGTVYFVRQGAAANQVLVAVGKAVNLLVPPASYTSVVAATDV